MQVGDCGPDQCGMRVQLAGDFKNKPKSLFFGFACLAHQTSLSECKVIALTDTICTKLWGLRFHYYSSLVKINHLFRSGTVAVGKSAKKHMDDVMMVKHISKKPGKCNTGRWGAVGDVEAHHMIVPLETLHKIMDDAFFNDGQTTLTLMMTNTTHPSLLTMLCWTTSKLTNKRCQSGSKHPLLHRRHMSSGL